MNDHRCVDEISVRLGESFLYVRPRCSELGALGVLCKGPRVVSPTCGRSAHSVVPSDDLKHALERDWHPDMELDGLRIVIRRFILDRVLEAKINGGVR